MYDDTPTNFLRIKKDISELSQGMFNCGQALTFVEQPAGGRKGHAAVRVTLQMTGGLYLKGVFTFHIEIPPKYPFHAPYVTCLTRVWHPNIDLYSGKVLLPILEKDWRPVLSINTVVFALQLLFLEPNAEFPANLMASETLARDPELFKAQVVETMKGGMYFGLEFSCHARQVHTLRLCSLGGGGDGACAGGGLVQGPGVGVKRKCSDLSRATERLLVHSILPRGSAESCSPPDSDLEAMCIEDTQEEGLGGEGERPPQRFGEQQHQSHVHAHIGPAAAAVTAAGGGSVVGMDDSSLPRKRPCISPCTGSWATLPLPAASTHVPMLISQGHHQGIKG